MWTLVCCLSLEMGTRIALKIANSLYKPWFEKQNAKVYRVVQFSDHLNIPKENLSSPKQEAHLKREERKSEMTVTANQETSCDKNFQLT